MWRWVLDEFYNNPKYARTVIWSHLYKNAIILPRQARDKHRGKLKKRRPFLRYESIVYRAPETGKKLLFLPSPAEPAYHNASFVSLLESNSGKDDVQVRKRRGVLVHVLSFEKKLSFLPRQARDNRKQKTENKTQNRADDDVQVRSMWAMSNDFAAGVWGFFASCRVPGPPPPPPPPGMLTCPPGQKLDVFAEPGTEKQPLCLMFHILQVHFAKTGSGRAYEELKQQRLFCSRGQRQLRLRRLLCLRLDRQGEGNAPRLERSHQRDRQRHHGKTNALF